MSLHPFRGVSEPPFPILRKVIMNSIFSMLRFRSCCCKASLFQHQLYMQENWHLLLNISAWSYRINIIMSIEDVLHFWNNLKNEAGKKVQIAKTTCTKNIPLKVRIFFSGHFYHAPKKKFLLMLGKFSPIFHSLSPIFAPFFHIFYAIVYHKF